MSLNMKRILIPVFFSLVFFLAGSCLAAERSLFGFNKTTLSFEYFIRLDRGGKVENTTETQEFFQGDQLRFTFAPQQDCYAYMIMKGSSGRYQMLFPSPGIEGGKNWITKDKTVTIPAQGDFTIDQQSGVEHIFFFFSNNKISRIEEFIHKGFLGADAVENAVLDLRNRLVDDYTWNLEKGKEKSKITLKSPEKNPVLIHEIFIRHK